MLQMMGQLEFVRQPMKYAKERAEYSPSQI